ncbi:MAG: polymer-forming cytoskeletal protein, partial [Gemmatimonadetes bacterium]|nr:polymer-forming cytoskeletal protein [Gemmatimonadota bacterium]
MRPLIPGLLAPVLLVATASVSRAQEFDFRRAGIPRDAAAHIQRVLDDPTTERFSGSAAIAADASTAGAVVISDGWISVAGTIRGDLIALRADVVLEPGAVVEGEVTVIAGALQGEDQARVGGTITVYGEGFDLFARARRFHGDRMERYVDDWWDGDRDDHADIRVRVGENYNRVEGLPVQFGPDIRTRGPFSTRIQALAVWRTAVGPLTRTEPMGYDARIEQFFGGSTFRVGAGVRSIVDPIESWSLTNLEASLAAVLFHDDQRDYFERTGWSAYMRVAPPRSPLDLTVEYRDEEHRSIAARDPWTLFNGDHTWREQPLVGEGDLRLVTGT